MRSISVRTSSTILVGMALGLALFFRGGVLPLMLAGLLLFGVLALLRPDPGLLFVPLAAPLFLIPVAIPGVRPNSEFLLPLSEVVLPVVLGASVANWFWRRNRGGARRAAFAARPWPGDLPGSVALVVAYAPQLLFFLAGVFGLLEATADRGAALRDFRRTIVEPLIFYALFVLCLRASNAASARGDQRYATWMVMAFSLSGALVALLGLFQAVGLDLVPYLGVKRSFSENVVVLGGVRRVASVYGHPNNLGLYLGRVWPVAAIAAIAVLRAGARLAPLPGRDTPRVFHHEDTKTLRLRVLVSSWFKRSGSFDQNGPGQGTALCFGLCALLCLGGILVSFSRGAWIGAAAALAVLTLPFMRQRFGSWVLPGLAALIGALVIAGGLGLMLRGNLGGDTAATRIALWREALALIRQHPLGIGLDQFYSYHNPEFGRSQIDPSLVGTSEQFAAHPHNLVLDIWLRMGPLGLLAFGWLLFRFFRAGWRSLRHPPSTASAAFGVGALAAMTAALVHGMLDNFYFLPDLAIAFWLLIALVELAGSPSEAY